MDGVWSIVNSIEEMNALTASAGDVCLVLPLSTYYKYDGSVWILWYKDRPSLAFKGITLETYEENTLSFQGITMEMDYDNLDTLFFGAL